MRLPTSRGALKELFFHSWARLLCASLLVSQDILPIHISTFVTWEVKHVQNEFNGKMWGIGRQRKDLCSRSQEFFAVVILGCWSLLICLNLVPENYRRGNRASFGGVLVAGWGHGVALLLFYTPYISVLGTWVWGKQRWIHHRNCRKNRNSPTTYFQC